MNDLNILIFAPHRDDELIGVGGTIIKYTQLNNNVYVCFVTHGNKLWCSAEYMKTIDDETLNAQKCSGYIKSYSMEYPAAQLETVPRNELNDAFTKVICDVRPDEVYIPHCGDMQKDHQITAEAAMVALRPKYEHKVKRIYAYETLSETEWNVPDAKNAFLPNVYVDISDVMDKKLEAMKCYHSQLSDYPNPRSIEAIKALSEYRGSTICVNNAEAFQLIREIK